MVSASAQIAFVGLALFIAGLSVFFATNPVSAVSGVLLAVSVLTMLGAIVMLAFSV